LASAQSSSMTRTALSGISGSEPHSIFNLLSGQASSSTPSTSTPATPSSSATHSHPSNDQPAPTQTSVPTGSEPPKEYDLVLEFPERPYDRWLVPRVPVVCERVPSTGNIEATLLLVALPFPKQTQTQTQTETQTQTQTQKQKQTQKQTQKQKQTEAQTQTQTQGEPESAESASPASPDPPQEVVQFRITKVHQAFWDNILNWVGGSTKVESNRRDLEKIVSPTKHPLDTVCTLNIVC
jgi:hypothetical protein